MGFEHGAPKPSESIEIMNIMLETLLTSYKDSEHHAQRHRNRHHQHQRKHQHQQHHHHHRLNSTLVSVNKYARIKYAQMSQGTRS